MRSDFSLNHSWLGLSAELYAPPQDVWFLKKNQNAPRPSSGLNSMFARLGTDYEIRNQWFFVILEAMTTD